MRGSQGFRPNHQGEALSRRAKRTVRWRPGERKWAKRRFWKWMRRVSRRELSSGDLE
jgi:hypothetical protein